MQQVCDSRLAVAPHRTSGRSFKLEALSLRDVVAGILVVWLASVVPATQNSGDES